MKKITISLMLGTLITLVLFFAGGWAYQHDLTDLSYLLYWQGYLLSMQVPCEKIYILGFAHCEVTDISRYAFYAGIPLGIVVYSLISYLPVRFLMSRSSR